MRRGFTLIELVLVLVIVAVVTHFAVREFGAVEDGRRERTADAQLEAIRAAAARFLSDVGRLPRLVAETNGEGRVTWTLAELWRRPTGVPAYAVTNIGGRVLAGGGWRGPYLHLPFGRERLLDPWGNPMEAEDDAGLARLLAAADGTVTNVCHYGARASADACRSMPLAPDGGATCSLVVVTPGGEASACRCYVPEDGVVRERTGTAANASQVLFEGLTPGERLVRVADTNGAAVVRIVTAKGPSTIVEVAVP